MVRKEQVLSGSKIGTSQGVCLKGVIVNCVFEFYFIFHRKAFYYYNQQSVTLSETLRLLL